MRNYFRSQLLSTGIGLDKGDLQRLVDDLVLVATEDYDAADPLHVDPEGACEDAWREWLRRLGGVRNITAYAGTLAAGER